MNPVIQNTQKKEFAKDGWNHKIQNSPSKEVDVLNYSNAQLLNIPGSQPSVSQN